MALWRQMLKLLCKTFQRKKEKERDEVNEWHSALKELQPHFQA
jgi:hypothetical protein